MPFPPSFPKQLLCKGHGQASTHITDRCTVVTGGLPGVDPTHPPIRMGTKGGRLWPPATKAKKAWLFCPTLALGPCQGAFPCGNLGAVHPLAVAGRQHWLVPGSEGVARGAQCPGRGSVTRPRSRPGTTQPRCGTYGVGCHMEFSRPLSVLV